MYYEASDENVLASHKAKDTNEDNIARRIRTFKSQTVPVLNYYGVQGRVKQVDANQSDEEIAAASQRALNAAVVYAVGAPTKAKQCKKLAEEFNYANVSMGNLIDAAITLNSPIGQRLKAAQEEEGGSILL